MIAKTKIFCPRAQLAAGVVLLVGLLYKKNYIGAFVCLLYLVNLGALQNAIDQLNQVNK